MHGPRLPILVLVAASVAGCGRDARPRPNALLITLDTTRSEAYGAFGAHPGLTPYLDRVAAEGVRFANARTTASLTMPAHASILTGLYPPRHSVRINGMMALPDEAETLAELASASGYETAAFVAAVILGDGYGVAQGFERFDQPPAPKSMLERHYESRPAVEVVDAALKWFAGRDRARPFFAWIHVYDAHAPYEPPPEFRERAGGDPYLGEAAYADAELGRFLDALRADGAYDDTAIVVVADHGEGLGDHGEETHGFFCFDSTIRVPLVVRAPDSNRGAFPPGARSDAAVSVVDVFPTLAELLALPLPGALDGQSLLGPVPADRGVYFEAMSGSRSLGWSTLSGWATADAKYLHCSRPLFFDLTRDPGETRDVLAEHGADAERFRAEIGRVAGRPSLAPRASEAGGEAMGAALAALGYTDGGSTEHDFPSPLAPDERVSPNDRIAAYAALQRAQDLSQAGRADEALSLLERIVAENPLNATAHFQLAGCLVQLERHREAVPYLLENLRLSGSWRGPHILLGICYEALDRKEEAVGEYRLALEHDPSLERIEDGLIRLLDELGRGDEANVLRIERRERTQAEGR